MNTIVKVFLIGSAFLASMTCNVVAQSDTANNPVPTPGQCDQGGKHWSHDPLAKLNLTEDQKSQVQPIMQKARDEMKAIHEDSTLTQEQKGQQIQTIKQSSDEQLKSILTPEQYQKLQEMRAHHKGGHHHPESSSTPAAIPPTT